jgi:hypothetical protein
MTKVEHYAELICRQLDRDPFQALPQVQGERITTYGGLVASILKTALADKREDA